MELDLTKYRVNSHSQCGEDFSIKVLFEIANINTGWLVEFGAWDGIYLSNTYYHYTTNQNFKLLAIEGDPHRYQSLHNNIGNTERSVSLNCLIETAGVNSLNEIFAKYNVDDIALLSIDVDGQDFVLWQSIDKTKYRPKIVIIEEGKWQDKTALYELERQFKEDDYNLVAVTGNFIFMDAKFGVYSKNTIHELLAGSGLQEYNLWKGLITKEQYDDQVRRQQGGQEQDLFTKLASPQIIYYNES